MSITRSVSDDLSGKAALASPSFTGTPVSTTASVDTNTTQIATTAYVIGQAASATSPINGTAATGTSLKYARQDHVHGSDTSRAPLASPTFTGVPLSTTASVDTNTTQVATTAFVVGQGYLKSTSASTTYAPLASPTLTGVPAAPTATLGTNTTQIATTAFVKAETAALVDSAPATLDTLNELAAALGDDANFATTITNTLANKLDVSSASSTYLTQASASTTYATKTYSDSVNINSQSASYTLVLADAGKTIEMNVASANDLTIPLNSSVDFPVGTSVDIIQYGSGSTTLVGDVGVTIRSNLGYRTIGSQYSGATIYKRDTNEWLAIGNLIQSASAVVEEVVARGVFGGGTESVMSNVMDYITIATTGNATDFGDLTLGRGEGLAACSSTTRGVFAGGFKTEGGNAASNVMDYITIATTGNATDFGDLTVAKYALAGCSSTTRGVFGGANGYSNVIEYITIASTGNATDFGDLTVARQGLAGCSSTTRGVFGGGTTPSNSNVMDYITIATTGNATDFGDLTIARDTTAGCSSVTRGVFGGGFSGSNSNVIDYITIATTGNATDFGDLTIARRVTGACSSSIRGVFGGGNTSGNTIDYITIATTGNATDFGDLTIAREGLAALSNAHGGLG
jgi:hypothetical protein